MNRFLAGDVVLPMVHWLRGEPVKAYTKHLLDCEHLTSDELEEYQSVKLKRVIGSAYGRSAYYKNRFDSMGILPSDVSGPSDLRKIPILEKSNLSELRRSLSLGPVSRRFVNVRKTAGSSGNPAVVLADRNTNAMSLAARARFFSWHDIHPGDKELRFWGRPLGRNRLKRALRNIVLNRMSLDSEMIHAGVIGDTLKSVMKFNPTYAYGYSSLISMYAEAIAGLSPGAVTSGLKAAICTSETITSSEKMRIKRVLGVPVISEYGCSEVDIIAFECPYGGLHVSSENIIVEIERDQNQSESCGEILITDLNNTLMPIIRYRTGDVGELRLEPCRCGRPHPCLVNLLGRAQGQYIVTEDGTRFHSQTLAYIFEDLVSESYPITRFQIIQKSYSEMKIFLVAKGISAQQRVVLYDRVLRELVDCLGADIALDIEYVDDRDIIDRGTKFRHFISEL